MSKNKAIDLSKELEQLEKIHKENKLDGIISKSPEYFKKQVAPLLVRMATITQELELKHGPPEKWKALEDEPLASEAAEIIKKINEVTRQYEKIRQGKYPEHFEINNTKLAKELPKDFINRGIIGVNVGHKKDEKPVVIEASLQLPWDDENLKIRGPYKLTKLDMQRVDAVCSLISEGNETFTAEMVHRVASGLDPSAVVTKVAVQQVEDSLKRARNSTLRINFKEQAEKWELKDKSGSPITDVNYEGYLLPLEKVETKVKGRWKEVYKAIKTPVIYSYALKTGSQLVKIPKHLHQADIGTKRTPETSLMWNHFIKELMIMQKNKMYCRTEGGQRLKVEKFAEDCEIETDHRMKYSRLIEKLDYFITAARREGFDFEVKKQRKSGKITAYDFIFPEK